MALGASPAAPGKITSRRSSTDCSSFSSVQRSVCSSCSPNHYLLLTLYGVGLASLRGAWDWFDAQRRVSLAAEACCSVAACSRSRRASSRTNSPAGALFANMFTWVWLAVFLGYGHRHLSHTNGARRHWTSGARVLCCSPPVAEVAVGNEVVSWAW